MISLKTPPTISTCTSSDTYTPTHFTSPQVQTLVQRGGFTDSMTPHQDLLYYLQINSVLWYLPQHYSALHPNKLLVVLACPPGPLWPSWCLVLVYIFGRASDCDAVGAPPRQSGTNFVRLLDKASAKSWNLNVSDFVILYVRLYAQTVSSYQRPFYGLL